MREKLSLSGQLLFTVPRQYFQDFKKNQYDINIFRAKIGAPVLVALSLFLLFSDLKLLRSGNIHPLHFYYIYTDITMLLVMSLLGIILYVKRPVSATKITVFHNLPVLFISTFGMAWCSLVGGIEYVASGGFSSYIIGAFTVAAAFYVNGLFLFCLYTSTLGLFLLVVHQLDGSPVSFLENHISLVSLVLFSWIISRFLYSAYAQNFVFKKRISEKNEELGNEIKERKKAQRSLQEAHNELEKRVEARTSQLREVNEQLNAEITYRMKAADELAESEVKYRTLFEDSLDPIILIKSRKIHDINPAWLRLHGFHHKQEILGKDIIEFIHPESRDIFLNGGESWMKNKNRIYQGKGLRKDGSAIDLEFFFSRIFIGGEELLLANIRDISEQKRLEKEKENLQYKLRRSEKMEAIGILAGGVAHDLNNILSGIVSYPELLLMDLPEDSPLRRPIQTIHKSGEKAATIVQDLLTLARRGLSVTEPVDLNRMILDFLESPEARKLLAIHPDVTVKIKLDENLSHVLGSPVHLWKTIMNLLSNAAEAISGKGNIIIRTENRHVHKKIKSYDVIEEGEYVVIEVSDTGEGIPPEDIDKIFEPFFTKKVMARSGTGLGMAVVWSTVKDHHGYIDIKSSVRKGTTITIYLPAGKEEVMERDDEVQIDSMMGNGESILIVDDIAEQREIASGILKRLGYSPASVSSGEEAIDYLRKKPADLLLLDMVMESGMDGLETYKKILEFQPRQKAIIASGFSETDKVKEVQRLGAGKYIKKPYMLGKIAAAVKSELSKT